MLHRETKETTTRWESNLRMILASSGQFDAPGAPFVGAPLAQFEAAALAAVAS